MESWDIWMAVLLLVAFSLKYGPKLVKGGSTASPLTGCLESEGTPLIDEHGVSLLKLRSFEQFQRWYIVIFLLVMLADWMQGPYVYKLYSAYGIATADIAILFIIGFGASGISGAFVGALADKLGRKNMCIAFCVFYGLCCATKHYHSFSTLLIGRILGGISTSILFSAFEAWMVSHHKNEGYPPSKLGETFGKAWSLNSFIAIIAGIITSYAVWFYEKFEIIKGGPYEIAAFDCSAIVLMIACLAINLKWSPENYGDASIDVAQSLSNAVALFQNDRRIIMVGVLQSGFESAMYLFVFTWTMALEDAREESIDHGMIFAVFMASCLIGTTTKGLITEIGWKAERIAAVFSAVAAMALFAVPQFESFELRFFAFIVFECCVGVYFPTIGGLRGKYVPDSVRATVMNLFRIPLNVIVCVVLYSIDSLGMHKIFLLASGLLCVASSAAWRLSKMKATTSQLTNGSADEDKVSSE